MGFNRRLPEHWETRHFRFRGVFNRKLLHLWASVAIGIAAVAAPAGVARAQPEPLTLTPSSGSGALQEITVTGGGTVLPPSLPGTVSLTFGGQLLIPDTDAGHGCSTDGDGNLIPGGIFCQSLTFGVPSGTSDSTAGPHIVSATDTSGIAVATATYTITPAITLAPAAGSAGSTFTLAGTGFDAFQTAAVSVSFGSTELVHLACSTDAAGSLITGSTICTSLAFTVPSNTADSVAGVHTVTVTQGVFPTTNTAIATYTITPAITLTPATGVAGSTFMLAGTGFDASQTGTVSVSFGSTTLVSSLGDAGCSTTPNGILTTGGASCGSLTLTVPGTGTDSMDGPHTVTAVQLAHAPTAVYTITSGGGGGGGGATLTITGTLTTNVNVASTDLLTITLPEDLTAPQSIKLHSDTAGVPTFAGETGTGKPKAVKIGTTDDYCIAVPTGTTVKFGYKDTVAGKPEITAQAAYAGGTASAPLCTGTANTTVASDPIEVNVQVQPKSLTITGLGFGDTQGTSAVMWDDTPITQLCTAVAVLPKNNCISKWANKDVTLVPPAADLGTSVSFTVRVVGAPGVVSAVSSETDNTFFYGPWITNVTPLSGSATANATVTIGGAGFGASTTVNWGGNHQISTKCSKEVAIDCIKGGPTKITVVGPTQALAGADAADGEVAISIQGGGVASYVDNTFRYGTSVITGAKWS